MTIVCYSNLHDECAGQEVPWRINSPDTSTLQALDVPTRLVCENERPCRCWCHRYEKRPRALQEKNNER